jgi:hypothetical protein
MKDCLDYSCTPMVSGFTHCLQPFRSPRAAMLCTSVIGCVLSVSFVKLYVFADIVDLHAEFFTRRRQLIARLRDAGAWHA